MYGNNSAMSKVRNDQHHTGMDELTADLNHMIPVGYPPLDSVSGMSLSNHGSSMSRPSSRGHLPSSGMEEDGDDESRVVYKTPTNRYQYFINNYVTHYELDKSLNERIRTAEGLWKCAKGKFCDIRHKPSKTCIKCVDAKKKVEDVLSIDSSTPAEMLLDSVPSVDVLSQDDSTPVRPRKRRMTDSVLVGAGFQSSGFGNVLSPGTVLDPSRSKKMVILPGTTDSEYDPLAGASTSSGGIETALILYARRNGLSDSKFNLESVFQLALDSSYGYHLTSFIQMVNLLQHVSATVGENSKIGQMNEKKISSIEEIAHKLNGYLAQAGYIHESMVRLRISASKYPALGELQDKFKSLMESIQLKTLQLLKSNKSTVKGFLKKVILANAVDGSIFITGRNIQSWDHSSEFLARHQFDFNHPESSKSLKLPLSYDQLVQAMNLIRCFGNITLTRLMHLIRSKVNASGHGLDTSTPLVITQQEARLIVDTLLDIFPIFVVRDSTKDEIHIVDQHRVLVDPEKRGILIGLLQGNVSFLQPHQEEFLSELRSIPSQDEASKAFLELPGTELMSHVTHSTESNMFAVFCFFINRFGSSFSYIGANNDRFEFSSRLFDGELSICEVIDACLQVKPNDASVSISRLNIDSEHASAQIGLLHDIAFHISDEIDMWSADDFPALIPCSSDVSAFSSQGVSFDELKYVRFAGYLNVSALENANYVVGDLKMFPKSFSLHREDTISLDPQTRANELRNIFERIKRMGQKSGNPMAPSLKPVQCIVTGNGIGWTPQSLLLTFYMGRVWRDMGLTALILASHAAGFADQTPIHEKLYSKLHASIRAGLMGISSIHNTVNTVMGKLEEVWSSLEKNKEASIEHYEEESMWYQDLVSVQMFFDSFKANDASIDPSLSEVSSSYLEEWKFLLRHLDRRSNFICFRVCSGERRLSCLHCSAIGPISAPNINKLWDTNSGKFFSPGWSLTSLTPSYRYRDFLEEIESAGHESPDSFLPTRHGDASNLLYTDDLGTSYMCGNSRELKRIYEMLRPDLQLYDPSAMPNSNMNVDDQPLQESPSDDAQQVSGQGRRKVRKSS